MSDNTTALHPASASEEARVGHVCLAQGEVQGNSAPYHLIEVQTSKPYQLEWKKGGRYRQLLMTPGSVCLLPAQSPRFLRWRDEIELLWVAIDPAVLARAAEGMELRGKFELPEHHGGPDPQLAHIASTLLAEQNAKFPTGRLFSDHLTAAFCLRLLQAYAHRKPNASPRVLALTPLRWNQVREYIEENLEREIRLDELAEVAGLSTYHFARSFRATVGTSPHQYLVTRRVEQARRLLTAGQMSPAEVAMHCGFYDQSHLSRHMKCLLGATPTSFIPRRK